MHQTNIRHALKSGTNRQGFTLIELLTVILIMGLLMAMILGVAAIANRKNLEAKAKADLETIRTALTDYQMDVGEYPGEAAWTNDLEGYIRDDFRFTDPWGHDYEYEHDTSTSGYRIYSLGSDGAEGTDETNADNLEAGRF